MKKIILACIGATFIFASCENEAQRQSRNTLKDLTSFVDSVNKATPDYSMENWTAIETTYKEKEAKVSAMEGNLTESDKKELMDTRNKYLDYKSRFETEKAKYDQKMAMENKQKIRDMIFGEGKATDLAFAWVNAANVVDVYKNFVSKVSDNKDSYSKQDWEEIKLIKDGLDKRRESLEKSLSNKQKLKIKELEAKFSAIKVIS
ncbi:MAG: hypothetical protein ACJ75J_03220 [Cytophagaceae bacterium]